MERQETGSAEKCELWALLSQANGSMAQDVNVSCNATITENAVNIMGLPLLETNYLLALVYCIIMSVALSIGVTGNVVIVFISLTTTVMNKIGKHFVINLALADLCVTAVADPMCILGVLKGERWFRGKWVLCEIVASMCLTACFCAFISLLMMTVNRYVFVCHHQAYFKIYKRTVCLLLCAACWILAFIFEFPNFVGWGDHYFDQKNHQCIWDRTASLSYTLTVTIGLIGGPLFIMMICFILIFWKIYQSKKDVFALNTDDPMRLKRIWIESFRSSRTLVVIFLAFLICWTPYAVITAIDVNNSFSTEVHLFVTLLAHLHSSLNFVIYMASNKNFRQSVIVKFTRMPLARKYRSSLEGHTQNSSDTTKSDLPAHKNKFVDGGVWKGGFHGNIHGYKTHPAAKDIEDRERALRKLDAQFERGSVEK